MNGYNFGIPDLLLSLPRGYRLCGGKVKVSRLEIEPGFHATHCRRCGRETMAGERKDGRPGALTYYRDGGTCVALVKVA